MQSQETAVTAQLCIHTYMGCECSLTDNAVDDAQDSCIDYIPED